MLVSLKCHLLLLASVVVVLLIQLPSVLSSYIPKHKRLQKRFDSSSPFSHWLSNPFPNYQQYHSPLQKRPENEGGIEGILGGAEEAEEAAQLEAEIESLLQQQQQSPRTRVISDCRMTVGGGDAVTYTFQSEGVQSGACGVYLFVEADEVAVVEFKEVDVDCESGGQVVFFDGWEENGKFFPGNSDHALNITQRQTILCNGRADLWKGKKLISSQNAGLIQYLIPRKGDKFSFTFTVARNPDPCNILVLQEHHESLTMVLSNGPAMGMPRNCSLTTLMSPSKVTIKSISVGTVDPAMCRDIGCDPSGIEDTLTIGGSPGMDSTEFQAKEMICGCQQRMIVDKDISVMCGTSTVRLVSSGFFENVVVLHIRSVGGERMKKDFAVTKRIWGQDHEIFCPKFLNMM